MVALNSVQGSGARFWWSKLAGFAALAGFCTALFIHVRTILHLPVPVESWPGCPLSFSLFAGALLVVMPMIRDASDGRIGGISNSRLVAGMPTWARVAIGVCALYVALNFAWDLVGHGAKVRVLNGEAIAYASGVSRVLSDDEYRDYLACEARMWSGNALLFYLVPAFYFLCGPGAMDKASR
jgi:hypothetical protein